MGRQKRLKQLWGWLLSANSEWGGGISIRKVLCSRKKKKREKGESPTDYKAYRKGKSGGKITGRKRKHIKNSEKKKRGKKRACSPPHSFLVRVWSVRDRKGLEKEGPN